MMRLLLIAAMPLALLPAAIAVAKDKKPVDPDKIYCRSTEETGSIMGGKKECHTHAQWQVIDGKASDDMNRMRGAGQRMK